MTISSSELRFDPRPSMQRVLLACLPGALALLWFNGWGLLIQLLLAIVTCVACDLLTRRLRGQPLTPKPHSLFEQPLLAEGSGLISALLLALALPSYAPWWLTVASAAFASLFGKALFGGFGNNPFNPAMLGYVVVLISFPVEMTSWPKPHGVGLLDGLQQIFGLAQLPDGWSQATALDSLKINKSLTMDELWAANPAFGKVGGAAVEWVNAAFLLGGMFLLHKRLISWHAPVGMLAALTVMSLLFWHGSGSDSNGSPLFHLFTGATMLGAFFIVTDPVSGATSNLGRLIFGAGVGILVYIIRTWGGYPDGVAFAVLLMNLAAPTIDYYSRPRAYGHSKPERGFRMGE